MERKVKVALRHIHKAFRLRLNTEHAQKKKKNGVKHKPLRNRRQYNKNENHVNNLLVSQLCSCLNFGLCDPKKP